MSYELASDFLNELFSDRDFSRNVMKSDVLENEDDYKVLIDMPGAKKENIHLEYKDFNLVVSYSIKSSVHDEENKNHKVIKRERYSGNYSRSFYLPNVDERSISASFNDGTLTVILLKKKSNSGTSIEIK